MNMKFLLVTSVLTLTLLTGCANSSNRGSDVGVHGSHGIILSDRCDGFSTGDLSRDAYCRELEDRIIEDRIIQREIDKEIDREIDREIENELIDPDYGVELEQ